MSKVQEQYNIGQVSNFTMYYGMSNKIDINFFYVIILLHQSYQNLQNSVCCDIEN